MFVLNNSRIGSNRGTFFMFVFLNWMFLFLLDMIEVVPAEQVLVGNTRANDLESLFSASMSFPLSFPDAPGELDAQASVFVIIWLIISLIFFLFQVIFETEGKIKAAVNAALNEAGRNAARRAAVGTPDDAVRDAKFALMFTLPSGEIIVLKQTPVGPQGISREVRDIMDRYNPEERVPLSRFQESPLYQSLLLVMPTENGDQETLLEFMLRAQAHFFSTALIGKLKPGQFRAYFLSAMRRVYKNWFAGEPARAAASANIFSLVQEACCGLVFLNETGSVCVSKYKITQKIEKKT